MKKKATVKEYKDKKERKHRNQYQINTRKESYRLTSLMNIDVKPSKNIHKSNPIMYT